MAFSAVVGGGISTTLVIWGVLSAGKGVLTFGHFVPLALVLLGTAAVALVQFPVVQLRMAIRLATVAYGRGQPDLAELAALMAGLSLLARRGGLVALEEEAAHTTDPFLRKGLVLIVDGLPLDATRTQLERDAQAMAYPIQQASAVFEALARTAQAAGVLGVVISGLGVAAHVGDAARTGTAIAGTFIALTTGFALAHLCFLPTASRLRGHGMNEGQYRDVMLEGLLAIGEGDGPRTVHLKLEPLLLGQKVVGPTLAGGADDSEIRRLA